MSNSSDGKRRKYKKVTNDAVSEVGKGRTAPPVFSTLVRNSTPSNAPRILPSVTQPLPSQFINHIDEDTKIYLKSNFDRMDRQFLSIELDLGSSEFEDRFLFRQQFITDLNMFVYNFSLSNKIPVYAYEEISRLYREYYIDIIKQQTYNTMIELATGGSTPLNSELAERYNQTIEHQQALLSEIEAYVAMGNSHPKTGEQPLDTSVLDNHTQILRLIENEAKQRKVNYLKNELNKVGGNK